MNPDLILGLVGQAFALYAQLRANAKAAGISDEDLDRVTANYNDRIARREDQLAPPTQG